MSRSARRAGSRCAHASSPGRPSGPLAVLLQLGAQRRPLRAQIEHAFQAECFDDYSTFEFHHVAYECPRHRYHLAADNVAVEFVRDGRPARPGEEGEILLTGLTNNAMPLIRYAIGDVGVPGDEICPCGRGFPTMQLIQGRVDDFVVLPDINAADHTHYEQSDRRGTNTDPAQEPIHEVSLRRGQ